MISEASDLTEELGNLCSGYDMPIVLTALTYLCADACVQSGLGEDTFLTRLNESIQIKPCASHAGRAPAPFPNVTRSVPKRLDLLDSAPSIFQMRHMQAGGCYFGL
jgi:hypothetical protein